MPILVLHIQNQSEIIMACSSVINTWYDILRKLNPERRIFVLVHPSTYGAVDYYKRLGFKTCDNISSRKPILFGITYSIIKRFLKSY